MTIYEGIQGAKWQSHSGFSPRDLLTRVKDENPKASLDVIWREFRHEVLKPENAEYLDVLIEYWLTNNARPAPKRRVYDAAPREHAEAVYRAAVQAKIVEKAEQIVLDMMMPNGKALGDCTGDELCEWGGAFMRIGEKVGAGRIVRDVLDETAARWLWKGGETV